MKGFKIYEVPQLAFTAGMFCGNINAAGNPNIGSGKLDGNGIRPDFFNDIHVRKAFNNEILKRLYKNWNLKTVEPAGPLAA